MVDGHVPKPYAQKAVCLEQQPCNSQVGRWMEAHEGQGEHCGVLLQQAGKAVLERHKASSYNPDPWHNDCNSLVSTKPREYPVPFANAIVRIRDDLIRVAPSGPCLPIVFPSGPEILASALDDDEGLFAFADMGSAYTYLRSGKGLKLPEHWYEHLPHLIQ